MRQSEPNSGHRWPTAALVCRVIAAITVLSMSMSLPRHARAAYTVGSWDLSRGGFDSLAESSLQAGQRALIQGYRSDVVFTATDVLTDAYLATARTFVLGGQTSTSSVVSALSAAEQTALFNFVSAGGNLLIATDNGDLDGAAGDTSRASIYAPFGMSTDGFANGTSVAVDLAHLIVQGPFGTLTSFPLSNSGWYTDLGPYAHTVFDESEFGNPMLATIEATTISATSGRVVAVADADVFASSTLSGNVVAYLIPVPEPSTGAYGCILLALASWAARRRNNRG